MAAIRSILVAVKDPAAKTQYALDKAVQLARSFNARLDLFHGITEPILADTYFYVPDEYERIRRETRARYRTGLEALAAPLREQGLEVRIHADWDHPAHEAIVRHARRQKCGLIVAECHRGRRLAPWLLHLTDWELLRTSPVPVLLIRSGASWASLNILAAIDPTHHFAKPAQLDTRILDAGFEFAKALHGMLHVVHAYVPVPAGSVPFSGVGALAVQQIAKGSEARARAAFQNVLADYALPGRQQHLVQGAPIDAIPRVAREIQCGLVVMGALSRSGLKRVFIGNTAEQLLGKLACDVLVVKPKAFESPVSRRRRGVHFIGQVHSLGI